MFFILAFLIIIFIIIAISMFSKITIEIKNINFSTEKIQGRHIQEDYRVIIKLKFLKIQLLKINITKNKLKKWKIKEKLEKQIVESKPKIDIDTWKELKELQFKVENLNLKIILGIEDAALTAIAVGILSTFAGNILKNKIPNDRNNYFEIDPLYINRNVVKISLNCIINIKLIHIIYMLYILNKKRRDDKNGRTSNRRSYAYSNE